MKHLIIILILTTMAGLAFAAAPTVTEVVATLAAGQVNIRYNLSADADCTVNLLVSSDNGSSYSDTPLTAVSGAIGNNITPGTEMEIVWHLAGGEIVAGTQYRVKVVARDNPSATAVDDFIAVEGGTFNNGISDVTVSSFYMDKYETTQAEYEAVMGTNPSCFSSVTNGPVETVTWFNPIEYCNRRSLQEGLTPCYSNGTYGTNPDNWPAGWNTDYINHTNVSCSWTANGYRLPSEAEWEYAARGGLNTHGYTYSGSNDLNAVGWYINNWDASTYTTHTVGALAPNELGIYDMSGNVWEWNWDIYGNYPSDTQTNPTGANNGLRRVLRGGGWDVYPLDCTVSYRERDYANMEAESVGFRCVRVSF